MADPVEMMAAFRVWCLRMALKVALRRLRFAYEHDPAEWPRLRADVEYLDRRIAKLSAAQVKL